MEKYKNFTEIPESLVTKYEDFTYFNDFLEYNPHVGYKEIRNSYEKILLGEKPTTGLDFEVSKAMFEIGKGVNGIMDFLGQKFITKIELLAGFFETFGIYGINEKITETDNIKVIINPKTSDEMKFDIQLSEVNFENLSQDLFTLENILIKNGGGNISFHIVKKTSK